MSADILASHLSQVPQRPRREAQRYGTIIVVGGGCYGTYYVKQLVRAVAASAIQCERVIVVDHDASCRVASEVAAVVESGLPLSLHVAEWDRFFDVYLGASARGGAEHDAIVPSPLMPHLMFDWVERRARERWPGRAVERRPLERAPAVPWQRADGGGTHYVSFAEWMCPINCIEPAMCPEIGGPRTWSMPPAIRAYVNAERARGKALEGPVLFHCRHRAYGVGMFDTAEVLQADHVVERRGTAGAAEVLIGTVSHCHGALGILALGGGTVPGPPDEGAFRPAN